MTLFNQLSQIGKNLASLGQAKMLALAGVGVFSIILIIAAAIFLNKPAHETLYIGLSGEDINQISLVLAESNIDFATGIDGNSITVPAGMTGRARMILAERGLPSSNTAGYELFDQVGHEHRLLGPLRLLRRLPDQDRAFTPIIPAPRRTARWA